MNTKEKLKQILDKRGYYNTDLIAEIEEIYKHEQALQLLQTDVIKSVCKHCDNKLCDSQTFNQQCFKCGKKPL